MKFRNVITLGALGLAGAFAVPGTGFSKPAATASTLDPAVIAPAEKLSQAFVAVAKQVRPAVVSVYAEKMVKYRSADAPLPFGDDFLQQFFGGPMMRGQPRGRLREYGAPVKGMGSGMILDERGTILTNYHVVNGFDEFKVQLADGTEYPAKVKGTDARSDVAVLQITGKVPADLPVIALGDSDRVEVGELVLAVGAPFGLPQTVTKGMISAKGRANVGVADIEDFLQTDAPINPGNSGGPLVNLRGEVVGINSAIATSVGQFSGVGFSIPINMVKAMLPELEKGKSITRGQLGVAIQDLTPPLMKKFGLSSRGGALVGSVVDGSAAAKAGIREGDVITDFNGRNVEDSAHLRTLVAATAPGADVRVEIYRNGAKKELRATIQKAKEGVAEAGSEVQDLGMEVRDPGPGELRHGKKGGVLVTDVAEGSVASAAGIQPGDLIQELDRKPVASARDFKREIQSAAKKGSALLYVDRNGAKLFVVLSQGEAAG